jgi:phosphoglycerate dehydrogenase-like enzyme
VLTLSALKHIPRNLGASGDDKVRFKKRMWLRQVREVRDFSSTSVGIVGFGRNGKKVARYLKSLGISLAYFDPYVRDDQYDRATSLKALIQKADCIVLTLTSNELTEGIIHAGLFADIKSAKIIVNTSRPNVVDSVSIYPLIKTQKLTYISDFPLKFGNGQISRDYVDGYFWSHHVAGASRDSTDKADFDVLFKAIRFFQERRK